MSIPSTYKIKKIISQAVFTQRHLVKEMEVGK